MSTRSERRREGREGVRLRALTELSLRKSPDPESPLHNEWYIWAKGQIFKPPPYMDVDLALARGIVQYASAASGNEEEEVV